VGNDIFNNFIGWCFAIEQSIFVFDWDLRPARNAFLGQFLATKPILFGDHSRMAPRSFVALQSFDVMAGLDLASGSMLIFNKRLETQVVYIIFNMSHFKYHLFFCLNQRENGKDCCAQHNAQGLFEHAKLRCKDLGLSGEGKVRVNKAGCLDRCAHGPVMVVYPEGIWYTAVDQSDIDEIIDTHFVKGQVVDRLRID
jgi:(2Fe-2S) ferredoxin